jgi:hypothetical protein
VPRGNGLPSRVTSDELSYCFSELKYFITRQMEWGEDDWAEGIDFEYLEQRARKRLKIAQENRSGTANANETLKVLQARTSKPRCICSNTNMPALCHLSFQLVISSWSSWARCPSCLEDSKGKMQCTICRMKEVHSTPKHLRLPVLQTLPDKPLLETSSPGAEVAEQGFRSRRSALAL